MFGLTFHRPSPDQLGPDEYHWTLSEEQRQERLAGLRAHVRQKPASVDSEGFETIYAPSQLAAPRQPEPTVAPTVPWTADSPSQPGLYWYRIRGLDRRLEPARVRLCMVVEFGGRLSLKQRGVFGRDSRTIRASDSSKYTDVADLAREWAGPIALPEDVALKDLEIA